MPKISILTPSYNHEKYIRFFIDSLLAQTEQDFEVIIVDDCSIDNNVQEIEKHRDSRIKLIKNSYNKGINSSFNTAFKASVGDLIIFFASDDTLAPNYLEQVLHTFEKNPNAGVIYSKLRVIDENNCPTGTIIEPNSKNKFGVLHDLFLSYNSIPSPGMAVKRNCLEQILPLDTSICQMQDYQMHIKLLLANEHALINEPLVNYRMVGGSSGISGRSPVCTKREILETKKLMDSFLEIKDVDLLTKIFPDELAEYDNLTDETIPYFLGKMALLSNLNSKKDWGYRTIMDFIATQENFDLLNKLYGFTFKEYINLANLCV